MGSDEFYQFNAKDFEEFLKCEMDQYLFWFGFEMTQTIHCDYSKVMILSKK